MVQAIGRWVVPCLALFLFGPLLSLPIEQLRGDHGGPNVTLLVGDSPALGLLAGLACIAVACVYGVIGAAFFGRRTGTLSAGFLVSWIAWRTGEMNLILRFHDSAGTLIMIAIEAFAVVLLTLAGAMVMSAVEPRRDGRDDLARGLKQLTTAAGLAGVGAGAVAAILIAWLIAFDAKLGQTLMAAILGGIAAGVASRLVAASMSEERPSRLISFASVLVAGIASPLIGLFLPGVGKLGQAAVDNTLPAPLLIQPTEWAAAVLIGVPMGIMWTNYWIDQLGESEAAPARSS